MGVEQELGPQDGDGCGEGEVQCAVEEGEENASRQFVAKRPEAYRCGEAVAVG